LNEKLKVKNEKQNPLKSKSYSFALRIVNLYKYLSTSKEEYILSKQVLRSGTAIGALVSEAEFGQSKADFTSKMSIALKEANESIYWLSLLKDSKYIDQTMYLSLVGNAKELTAMLVATVKTTKK
jgi:four helix bundle protein